MMSVARKPRRRADARFTGLASLIAALFICSGANATLWKPGDFTTYAQGLWAGGDPAAPQILQNGFLTVYPSSVVEVGIPGPGGYSMRFTDPVFVQDYLPSAGLPAPLTGDLINPTTSSSGNFGADVLSLKFNVDYSAAGLLPSTQGYPFGNLVLYAVLGVPHVNGLSVSDVLGLANIALGGGDAGVSISDLSTIVDDLNGSFSAGNSITSFPLHHLAPPSTVISQVPEPPAGPLLASGLLALALMRWKRRA